MSLAFLESKSTREEEYILMVQRMNVTEWLHTSVLKHVSKKIKCILHLRIVYQTSTRSPEGVVKFCRISRLA